MNFFKKLQNFILLNCLDCSYQKNIKHKIKQIKYKYYIISEKNYYISKTKSKKNEKTNFFTPYSTCHK